MNKSKIAILFTGGTIAGQSSSCIDTTSYEAGVLSGAELLAQIPIVQTLCTPVVEQFLNVISTDITDRDWIALQRCIEKYLSREDIEGIVITHGTATMEETAAFIQFTTNTDKPIVFVGAMRPNSAISADGPMNLLQAIALAVTPQSHGRGVLICANDRISSAVYTSKTHTQAVDTFKAQDVGYLGTMMGTTALFYYMPSKPVLPPTFKIESSQVLPKVAVVHEHIGDEAGVIDYFLEQGAQGLIIAATGNGTMSTPVKNRANRCMEQGIPVVKSSVTGAGYVWSEGKDLLIPSGFLNPQKARLLLALCLSNGLSLPTIRRYFGVHL